VAAARTLEPMAALTERYPDAGLALTLDVTDPQQRADAISQAEARFGAIDILANNAGIDFIGAIEEQEEKDYRAQFEVNFFAAAALLREVLPGMRARGRGTIINISSMDGIASLPVNGWYASSKFALEGLTEALWQELEPIGLRAFLVEPGSFRTGLETRTKFSGTTIDDYAATSGAFREMLNTITPEMWPGDPRPCRRRDLPRRQLRRSPSLGDSRQRRPSANRRETRHAARRIRRRQRTRVQHRLPQRYRTNRALAPIRQ
jgi:NAD(P)-dependent dehydrogenase (short-subunit alcohol dehydrogenase family)